MMEGNVKRERGEREEEDTKWKREGMRVGSSGGRAEVQA